MQEALGRTSMELLRTELPAPIEEIEASCAREGHWEGEVVQHARDGRRLVELAQWVPQLDGAGRIVSIMAINTDITSRKRAELELQVANADLARSNGDLEQFAYAASHDLAEPLRAISGPVSLLARRYHGALDPDADEFIDFAVDGCRRMQTLIDDMLAYSRVGRQESQPVEVDMNDVLAVVESELASAIAARRACVEHTPLPTLCGEATQLRQLLENLVGNAIKYTAPEVEPVVRVSAERQGEGWRVTVTDNGIGIEPQHRERVFGMFKRLHTRDAYPGTGIGLALCKKIVERHGGEIGVEPAPTGGGSTFWFRLPDRQERP